MNLDFEGVQVRAITFPNSYFYRKRIAFDFFDNVAGLFCVIDLSNYHKQNPSNEKENLLNEKISLYSKYLQNPQFLHIPKFLLLNNYLKMSILLKKYPFKDYFKEYDSETENTEQNMNKISDFIVRKMDVTYSNVHPVCVVDEKNIEIVMKSIMEHTTSPRVLDKNFL